MKKIILLSLFAFSFSAKAQNLPSCDSLIINCCAFDSFGPNTLTIYASNYSSNLFDYPGFVLLNAVNDTIAKETVNYFGIGGGPQPHTLDIVAPLILPFQGKLELYTLFYQSLDCTFPFYIPDTVSSVHDLQNRNGLKIYPNPAVNATTVELEGFQTGNDLSLAVFDVTGREVMRSRFDRSPMEIGLEGLSEGMYMMWVIDKEKIIIESRKLMVLGE